MRSPVHARPDITKPFQLRTYASEKGVGVALIQIQDDKETKKESLPTPAY